MPLAMILALAASAAQPQPQPQPQPQTERPQPVLIANADGSWTITRPIGEDPVPLGIATRGLVRDEDEGPRFAVEDEIERDALREDEDQRLADQAFENAIEGARSIDRPR